MALDSRKTRPLTIASPGAGLILTAVMTGPLLGVLLTLDPYVTNIIAPFIRGNIDGVNVLKLFPFELTFMLFLLVIILFIMRVLLRRIMFDMEKTFVVLYLILQATISLHSMGKIDLSEISIVFFMMIFLIKSLFEDEIIVFTRLDMLNLMFAATLTLSSVNGPPVRLFLSLFTMSKFIFLSFLMANFIYRKDLLQFTIKWLVIVSTASAALGILQEMLFKIFDLLLLGSTYKTKMKFIFEYSAYGKFLRVPGFFEFYRLHALFLVSSIAVVFNRYIYRIPNERSEKFLYVGQLGVMCIALFLTFSKDAILSLMLVLIMSLLVRWPFLIIHMIVGGLFLVSLILASGFGDGMLRAFWSEISFGESHIRLQLAREGCIGFFRHPWLGTGVGNGDKYTSHFFGWPAHNSFIQAADEIGLIGFFAFCLILGYTFFILLKENLVVDAQSETGAILRGLLFGFVALVVGIQFHPMYLEKFHWLYMGIAQACTLISGKRSSFHTGPC